jgi:hypothetical protein
MMIFLREDDIKKGANKKIPQLREKRQEPELPIIHHQSEPSRDNWQFWGCQALGFTK